MYTLKSIVQRGTLFGTAFSLVAAIALPAAAVFADENALNPLTQRSLLLSSSAPGFQDTDGSGNSEVSPNAGPDGHYAPPGSGPNGKKSGQRFSFRVSTNSAATSTPIQAFTLQYCTSAAGNCQAPGNNSGDARTPGPDRMDNATAHALSTPTSDFDVVTNSTNLPASGWQEGVAAGTYQVLLNDTPTTGWTMSTKNVEDTAHSGDLTGKNNFIFLTNSTGISPNFNDKIEIRFAPSSTNYITNPGAEEFFVKINTYKSATENQLLPTTRDNIIDGGVTVANVMTDSIHITTKVLETMAFSVGVHNRDRETLVNPEVHGTCDIIERDPITDTNQLQLGDDDAEFSLKTTKTYDVNSYWRLSSNSSGGATVYYSGNTLANTVGDEIAEIGATAAASTQGTEQFGLAFADAGSDQFSSAFNALVADTNTRHRTPGLAFDNLAPGAQYANGVGTINTDEVGTPASFAFEKASNTVPRVIATNNQNVISCATAKMRYIANIAADTPAGVYTTKINYLAAPQY